jgi:hypothetical protein
MPTYLSNELSGTSDAKTMVPVLGTKSRGSVLNGRVKRFRATISLGGQVVGDLFQLFTLPAGASVVLGSTVTSVSLGAATLGIGTPGAATKYRGQSAGMTLVDTPLLFAASGAASSELAADEPVFATLGGANLPATGTLVIDMLVSLPS